MLISSTKNIVISGLLLLIPILSLAQSSNQPGENNPYGEQIAALTNELEQEGYEINQLLDDNRFELYDSIGDRFRNSAEKKTLGIEEYKRLLNFEDKIARGIDFIEMHSRQLQKAEQQYDIPKEVITAIIGIESDFGQNIGSYNPFNVYVSMAVVNYRADFAKAQLKELLEFINRKQLDVFTLKSSYAGAMSYAQFIPYSVNKWWVGDDIFDMNNNILSVANYLAYFEERSGSLSTAVLRYNPSDLYRDFVLELADAIEKESMLNAGN